MSQGPTSTAKIPDLRYQTPTQLLKQMRLLLKKHLTLADSVPKPDNTALSLSQRIFLGIPEIRDYFRTHQAQMSAATQMVIAESVVGRTAAAMSIEMRDHPDKFTHLFRRLGKMPLLLRNHAYSRVQFFASVAVMFMDALVIDIGRGGRIQDRCLLDRLDMIVGNPCSTRWSIIRLTTCYRHSS